MNPSPRLALYFKAGAVLAVSAVVLLLAWPRLQASLHFIPVDRAIQNYYQTHEIPSERLPVLIRFADEANAWLDHYRHYDGISVLHLLRAVDLQTPALERVSEYRLAGAAAVASLERAPAQPATWMRLATIRWTLHDEPEAVLTPWKMSIFTGRTDSSLYGQRVDIGYAHRDYLDDEGLAMLRDQLLLSWRLQAGTLVGVLARRDPELAVTRELLSATHPVALAEMEAWLEKLR